MGDHSEVRQVLMIFRVVSVSEAMVHTTIDVTTTGYGYGYNYFVNQSITSRERADN